MDTNHPQFELFEYQQQPTFDINNIKQVSVIKKSKVPKANEIVQTAKQIKSGLYSYKIINETLAQVSKDNEQIGCDKLMYGEYNRIRQKQSLIEIFDRNKIIYDKYNIGIKQFMNSSIYSLEKLKKMKKDQIPLSFIKEESKPFFRQDNLIFHSRFQSANLLFVSKNFSYEYNLLLQNDINTKGYNNWFYFKINNKQKGIFRFNIINYGKAGWLYNQGMGVATYSRINFQQKAQGWKRTYSRVKCFKNNVYFLNQQQKLNYNTLTWQYEFENSNDEVYFAYSIPYTYTELCLYLDQLQTKRLPFFHRKLIGKSLAGNRLELLTITQNQKISHEKQSKPAIIIISRVHPGQTVSSWISKGIIEHLVSDQKDAIKLREKFIFKIIPMLNPDGVIHGNYRCSLSGRDLNRRWIKPDRNIFPEIYFSKKAIHEIYSKHNIELVLDLHGHSRKKKMFMYGCSDYLNPIKCRQFPFLLSKINKNFQYRRCNFMIQKYKESTARVTLFRKLKISTIFTLQTSMCGNQEFHFSIASLKQMGVSICNTVSIYFSKIQRQSSHIIVQKQQVLKQLYDNQILCKVGNEENEGSQSQPSLDNIPIEQINKIGNQLQKKKTLKEKPNKNRHNRSAVRQHSEQFLSKSTVKKNMNHNDNVSTNKISMTIMTTKVIKQTQNLIQKKKSSFECQTRVKPSSARKNMVCKPSINCIKHITPPNQKVASRQIKFINFPLVLTPPDQMFKNHNFQNKQKCSKQYKPKSGNESNKIYSDGLPMRLRTFLRFQKSKNK